MAATLGTFAGSTESAGTYGFQGVVTPGQAQDDVIP